jgi:hypothetical protein
MHSPRTATDSKLVLLRTPLDASRRAVDTQKHQRGLPSLRGGGPDVGVSVLRTGDDAVGVGRPRDGGDEFVVLGELAAGDSSPEARCGWTEDKDDDGIPDVVCLEVGRHSPRKESVGGPSDRRCASRLAPHCCSGSQRPLTKRKRRGLISSHPLCRCLPGAQLRVLLDLSNHPLAGSFPISVPSQLSCHTILTPYPSIRTDLKHIEALTAPIRTKSHARERAHRKLEDLWSGHLGLDIQEDSSSLLLRCGVDWEMRLLRCSGDEDGCVIDRGLRCRPGGGR